MDNTKSDPSSLLKLVREAGGSLGAVMLRLAHMAAAQHRANARPKRVKPWTDLHAIQLSIVKDTPGHGSPALTRSARELGPAATEGDR